MTTITKPEVILERYPYRYVQCGLLENGFPDYRIQKWNEWSKRYKDMYYCDNGMHGYCHRRYWLDPWRTLQVQLIMNVNVDDAFSKDLKEILEYCQGPTCGYLYPASTLPEDSLLRLNILINRLRI